MLVNWYKLDGNGEDSCGRGPVTNEGSYSEFNGEVVSNNARRIFFTPMDGDFTITAEIYRRNMVADWCVDMSLSESFSWGTGDGGTGCIWYHPSGRDLIINLGTSQKYIAPIIQQWYTAQISREGDELSCYINGILVHTANYKLPTIRQVHFFNAGSYQTGGGYVKNVKIYNRATIYNYHNLFNNGTAIYGIKKGAE